MQHWCSDCRLPGAYGNLPSPCPRSMHCGLNIFPQRVSPQLNHKSWLLQQKHLCLLSQVSLYLSLPPGWAMLICGCAGSMHSLWSSWRKTVKTSTACQAFFLLCWQGKQVAVSYEKRNHRRKSSWKVEESWLHGGVKCSYTAWLIPKSRVKFKIWKSIVK